MSNFRNVSTSEPCPICGKPDWCSIQYVEGGEKLHYCRRILCGDNVISPISGQTFVFIKQAKDGSSLYKEEQAYLASREEWIKNNQLSQGTPPPKKKAAVVSEISPQKANEEIVPLGNEQLDKIYRRFLKDLYLRSEHKRYFLRQGWSHELIARSMVKSMPRLRRIHLQALHAKE